MKLVIISDLHFEEINDWQQVNHITSHMISRIKMKLKENEQVVCVVLGDIINRGSEGNNTAKFAEAGKFFNKIKAGINNDQFYFIPGNHEIKENKITEDFHVFAAQYNTSYKHFSLEQSVFSCIVEGTNLIFVDSTLSRKHDANGEIDIEMLKKHLESKCKNLIFMHHPPCEQDGADRIITNSTELIETHANFVFYGHQHGYVKVPDFLEKDTDIHSVGALFKTKDGAKSEFLLLDVTDGKINYARRYTYVSTYFHSQLMFPKKWNLLSHEQKLDKQAECKSFINRKYIKVENSSKSLWESPINEETLLKSNNLILLSGDAGMGKTYSLANIYNVMIKNEDYFPLWLSLRNVNYETIKEHLSYTQKNTIDNKTPILFIDGLDEMNSEYTSDFLRDIGSAIRGDNEVKILISMRANYQISIDKFEKYKLKPLTQKEIEQIAKNNEIEDIEDFINQIYLNNYMILSQNPFYLFEIINLYKRNNSLPKRNELFRHMIKVRFQNGDERNPCEYEKRLMNNEYSLLESLKKLAFFMSSTQEYSIDNIKYTQILKIDVREQFQKIGLVTKTENLSEIFWEFEHRNFAEFLTADLLRNIDLDSLLNVITYKRECKKLRPSWVNIVGFILNLRKSDDLKKWLIENAINELCDLQPDSLTEDDRDTVFIVMFEEYSKKNIPIYTDYHGDKLTKYFQSRKVVDYLLETLRANRSDYKVINAFYILEYCTELYGNEDVLLDTIKGAYIVSDSSVDENIIIRAIRATAAIASVYQTDSTTGIFSVIKSDLRADIIGATCGLIAKINTSDEHSDYLLEKLKHVTILQENYSAQKNLVEAVEDFNDIENILKAVRVLIENKGYVRLFRKEELFSTLVGKLCSNQAVKSIDITKKLVEIFIICACEHRQYELKAIKECFKYLGVSKTAFELLTSYKLSDIDMLFSIEAMMDEELTVILLDYYNGDKVNDDVFKWYARRLHEESPIYLEINQAVMKKEGITLERNVEIDWEKLNSDGVQKFFDTLFNKSEFEELLCELRKYYNEDTVCDDLLDESFHNIPTERKDLNCIVTSIFHSRLQKTKLKDFITEIDWDLFSIHQIIHTLEQNKNVAISDDQNDFIKQYYLKMISEINFEKNTMSEYNIFIAKQMVFLIDRFEFEISDEKLLEFLVLPWYVFESSSVSSESETLKYVKKKIKNKQKLYEKVIFNLKNKELNPYAIQTHIFYCLQNRLTDAVELSTTFLKDRSKENSFLQNSAVEYLIAIKGERYVDSLVDEYMDEHLLKYLSIKLQMDNQTLISVLVKKNEESESKLIYLEELIILNPKYALDIYFKLAKNGNSIPDMHDDSSRVPEITDAIRKIQNIKLLDYIGELFVLSLSEGFVDKEHFGLFSSASAAIQNFIQVDANALKNKLQELILQNPENEKVKSHCNYYLNNIEKQLDISSDNPWDMHTAIKFIERLSKEYSTL
jgi:hypothetical protein